jgi:hypothetical protein
VIQRFFERQAHRQIAGMARFSVLLGTDQQLQASLRPLRSHNPFLLDFSPPCNRASIRSSMDQEKTRGRPECRPLVSRVRKPAYPPWQEGDMLAVYQPPAARAVSAVRDLRVTSAWFIMGCRSGFGGAGARERPADRFAIGEALAHGRQLLRLGEEPRMAGHAGCGRSYSREGGFLD